MTHTSTEQPSDQFMQLWQAYCDKKIECEDLRERIAELEVSQAQVLNELREAAQTVVDRWDSPLWKDVPATADCIARLREALEKAPQSPSCETQHVDKV